MEAKLIQYANDIKSKIEGHASINCELQNYDLQKARKNYHKSTPERLYNKTIGRISICISPIMPTRDLEELNKFSSNIESLINYANIPSFDYSNLSSRGYKELRPIVEESLKTAQSGMPILKKRKSDVFFDMGFGYLEYTYKLFEEKITRARIQQSNENPDFSTDCEEIAPYYGSVNILVHPSKNVSEYIYNLYEKNEIAGNGYDEATEYHMNTRLVKRLMPKQAKKGILESIFG